MSHLPLGVSSYSFWHFTPEKVALETIFDKAAQMGLAGVEILHAQLEREDNAYLQKLKRHAFQHGLCLYSFGSFQNFVFDDKAVRQKQLEHTKRCIDLAHEMGIPSMRVNAGSWQREGGSGLIESRGWVTPWEGFSEDDGFNWAIEGLNACLEHAEKQGVMLLLENHWGLTTTADGMIRILGAVNSPWLRAILDTGNFYYDGDMYTAMAKIAPYVDLAHAKTYPGGGKVFTIELDYPRIFGILKRAGFKGFVSIEMEGHEHADLAVPKSMTMLQEAWSRA
jgi:L-ribulose-5-phosphate 3-epimerase